MTFKMTVSNPPSGGIGSVTGFPISNCQTNSKACTVETIQATGLPWPAALVKLSFSNYLVIKGIQIELIYAGAECVLAETLIELMGTAGGLIDNSTQSVIFNSSSFTATGTKLLSLGAGIEFKGTFAMAATGLRSGQTIAVL